MRYEYEHPIDRIKRVYAGQRIEFEFEGDTYRYRIWQRPYHWSMWRENPFEPLDNCEKCGRLGSKRFVQYRAGIGYWNVPDWRLCSGVRSLSTLCMGCWNRVRAAVEAKERADALAALAKKLLREIAKHGNQSRRIARELDGLYREGEGRNDGSAERDSGREAGGADQPIAAGRGERAS